MNIPVLCTLVYIHNKALTSSLLLVGRVYCCSCLVCVLLSYVYVLYYVCIAVFFYFRCRLLARSQYSEGPATGHLNTGFSWFPCA